MCYKTWCMCMVDGECVHRACPIEREREAKEKGEKYMTSLDIAIEKERVMKIQNQGLKYHELGRKRV